MALIREVIIGFLFINVSVMVYLFLVKMKSSDNKLFQKSESSNSINTSTSTNYKSVNYYKEKTSFFDKIESVLMKSNIRKHLPWINSKFMIGFSIFIGLAGFIVSYKLLNNAITSLVLFGVFSFIPIYLLQILVSYNFSKIERNFLYFLNILINFAQLKDDVYFAFEKSIGYIEEPLNGYCKTFVEEVKRGLPIEEALENLKDKIDNNKFRLFLRNAQLCVRYGGSFLKLTANNLETMKKIQMEKARRKSETSLGKAMIYVMMIINVVLAIYMFGMYPDTLEQIRNDFYGQVIVLINTINLFIVFYLSLRLEKLDY